MSFGSLMAFVRTTFPSDPRRNGSILRQLFKRYGETEVEVMVKGAAQLGWKDLRGLWAKEGVGRNWARTAYWQSVNTRGPGKLPENVKAILRELIK